jgi:hypothetical protein
VAGVERDLREVAVVEVEGEECRVKLGGEFAGERGFAGAGTTCDGDEKRAVGEGELFGHGHEG